MDKNIVILKIFAEIQTNYYNIYKTLKQKKKSILES